ncbi:unnamed protein product [Zymoseptoria tritici ST99CH_1E4]|uniref:Exocyst complex component Sec3 PIP2-binding N-terminal domain-containing protein n=1 Tax=Zymoseptoria tritici ST99CH_1E4 TaxID=1276532 RepID=A0A2H1GBZ1_ZYMTR|nr:unnamed protein product [Zymoseptoria tritici ST99CH_1E4]
MNGQAPRPGPGSSAMNTPPTTNPAMSRAERFEDEKRRVIESLFVKTDQNGQLAESYITHIRIEEDAQYASAPPPPDSRPENKKARLIIIAVRSTGRVRMHKARENNNGSFSIGKTWNLEELSAIESYAGTTPPQDDREAQQRAWAGSVGFTVTITKPYYWQAGTSKEKDFFIASVVKIYRKYTKGQVPELRGFDERERAAILGQAAGQAPPPVAQQQPLPLSNERPPRSRSRDQGVPLPPQPPFVQRDQSREGSRYRQSPGPPASIGDVRPGSRSNSRHPNDSPAPRFGPGHPPPNGPRVFASTEQLRGQSRDRDPRADNRPGTASATAGYRSPSLARSQNSAFAPPPDSPKLPSFAPPTTQPFASPLRPHSPALKPGLENDRKPNTPPTAAVDLFQNARQRYMEYQPGSTPPPPQLLASADMAQNGRPRTPPARAASPAVDLIDRAQSPREPGSPTTPERSRRRPIVDQRISETGMRPAPLTHTRNVSGTANGNPEPDVTPLQVPSKTDSPPVMPGAFSPPFSPTSEPSPTLSPSEEKREDDAMGEQFRPGLGPMFKKKALADRMKKAATAASAFKPRPGGAAEKILLAKQAGGPDGITGVVPRPAPASRQDSERSDVPPPVEEAVVPDTRPEEPPTVEVSAPLSPRKRTERPPPDEPVRSVELVDDASHLQAAPTDGEIEVEQERSQEREVVQPQLKIKHRSAQHERYLAALDIDRSLLEGKGLEFESMLVESGWGNEVLQPKHLAALENDIRREQGRVEAGSWLSHTDSAREERVAYVDNLLDKAIAECDELEGLLTLYHVELSSLNDDIAFIEAQSQGLQVQSANQKLLQSELQNLVETMSLGRRVMDPIRYNDLSQPHSVEEVESSLVRLYQAMLTMDPTMRSTSHSRPRSRGGLGDSETANMTALREKKAVYDREISDFCQRFMQFLDGRFAASTNSVKDRVLRAPSGVGLAKLHEDAFTEVRTGLWMYVPLILFTKEMNAPAWKTMMRLYSTRLSPLYKDAFSENIANWKRTARAATVDDAEVLFTTQEKEDPASGGLTSTARKLTVKRSQTLAKTLRGASGLNTPQSPTERPGALTRSAAFAAAMDEMAPLINREQNFFVDFFHATSLRTEDFIDAVEAAPPIARTGTNLKDFKPTEPDQDITRDISSAMDQMFAVFNDETRKMAEWSMAEDPIQGVGVLASLNKHRFYLQGSNQLFLLHLIDQIWDKRLLPGFERFVADQIRAIEDTKVKIKKRKGVIAFMRKFPNFSAAVETTFATVAGHDYDSLAPSIMDVRNLLDGAYDRINRAMFDSLKVIAKESPVAGVPSTKQQLVGNVEEAQEKEMLNYYILLLENMNHYIEEVDDGNREGVLAEWKGRALMERSEAMEAYVTRVLRRPLGKLLDFLDAAESILATNPSQPTAVSSRPSYSRKALRHLLKDSSNALKPSGLTGSHKKQEGYDARNVRQGIVDLRERVDKHFKDAGDETQIRGLTGLIFKECERVYEKTLERLEELVREVYPPTEGEKSVEIEFSRADVQAGFRR